ncbi:hypothetical protein [Streptomyces uncialis]|uniref:hypothetical protein n=1 Tax=Streptomyces uncialis TaxID=1048205 RepID=UPI003870CA3A|nr:hypothetical protein OG924_01430 [Streptomyces uncialis]
MDRETGPDTTRPVRTHPAGTPCTGPRCRTGSGHAARAVTGTVLCLTCRTRLADALARLPALYQECGERHFRARTPAWAEAPGPRRPPTGPLHVPACDVRHAVLGVLACWAGTTVQKTGVRAPRRAVGDLCVFLHRNLGFLVRHPAAGEFAAEVADVRDRAERVARPERTGRTAVGPCAEPGCAGRLTARAARDRDDPARVTCDTDPAHTWSGPEWLSLGRRLQTADTSGERPAAPRAPLPTAAVAVRTPRWLRQEDVTALWGVPRGSVYRLASEQGWERRRLDGRTYYAAEDVRRALVRTEG